MEECWYIKTYLITHKLRILDVDDPLELFGSYVYGDTIETPVYAKETGAGATWSGRSGFQVWGSWDILAQ